MIRALLAEARARLGAFLVRAGARLVAGRMAEEDPDDEPPQPVTLSARAVQMRDEVRNEPRDEPAPAPQPLKGSYAERLQRARSGR